ncbi:MAG: hypothetical protein WKF82_13215 [Nocardioidaceae bacterium]
MAEESNSTLVSLGKGVVAGLVGTSAMALSERLEMAITGREASNVPGQVGAHLLPGKDPDNSADVEQLSAAVHWAHGLGMGAVRGLLDVAGLRGPAATAAHFALVWSGDAALYRALGIAPLPWQWPADELAADVLHKGVYAVTTGAVYEALS